MLIISPIAVILQMNEGSLDLRDRELFLIATDSMDGGPLPYDIPTLPERSLAMVRHCDASDLAVGDVVAYRTVTAGAPVFHRVMSMEEDRLVVKGDNVGMSETIPAGSVIGKVIGVSVPLGMVLVVMKSPAPLFFLAVLALYGLLKKQGGLDEDKVGLGGDSGDDACSCYRWGWLRV